MDLDTLYQDILSALPSNPIATKHISADGRWSTDPNGLLLLDNRIYVLSTGNLHICILQYNHNHILTGYFGQNKTLELVCCGYSWPSLCTDIQQFCKSCVTYIRFKPQHHKPYGSLKQLPIPERPWNSISMDFIEKLLSSSGFDTILVIVDQLTKQAIFIPAHDTIMSADLARLFVLHVFSKHGIPSYVTSDRSSDPMKSLSSLVLYHSLSVFQSPCALFIQSSMCQCSNSPYPTLSLREYSQPLLQS